ncbi:MAG: glycosyltransferase [Candidatus Eisenbacteria bacterium]|nr:glycosyltransferase [Candidatus Eisenbacteria bacterium]
MPRGKRILIIVENLPVPFDRRVWLESTTLKEAGYEVSVICPMGSKYPEAYEELEGIRIYRYPPPPPTTTKLSYAWEFPYCWFQTLRLAGRVARETGFDAIHACNPPDTFFLIGFIYKLLRGARFVYDQHDLCPELYLSRFGGRRAFFFSLLRSLEWATYRTADMIISTNESYREHAVEVGGFDRDMTFVVRSGPLLSRFRPVEPEPELKRGRKHLVCYLGVMAPQDGVDYLLRAIRHVVDVVGRKNIHFVLIGSGDSFDDIKGLRDDLGLTEYVEMTGRISDADVQRYLSTADLCVCPDPNNPLNDVSTMNKVLEYMTFGRPMVSFDLKESRYSAQDGALYATPNDEIEFGERIIQLLDDRELAGKMGEANRERIVNKLSWEHTGREVVRAYDALFGITDVEVPVPGASRSEGGEEAGSAS